MNVVLHWLAWDFSALGSLPVCRLFQDRIEIANRQRLTAFRHVIFPTEYRTQMMFDSSIFLPPCCRRRHFGTRSTRSRTTVGNPTNRVYVRSTDRNVFHRFIVCTAVSSIAVECPSSVPLWSPVCVYAFRVWFEKCRRFVVIVTVVRICSARSTLMRRPGKLFAPSGFRQLSTCRSTWFRPRVNGNRSWSRPAVSYTHRPLPARVAGN